MNLILIGYRGTGKSTIARLLAERLGWRFVDTDDLVEAAAGTTVAQIFLHQGEQAFRELESEVLAQVCQGERTVIAAGGGIVLSEENRQLLAETCHTVWLVASAEQIEQRIAADATTADRRPKLTNLGSRNEIERLLELREPFYRQSADLPVDTEGKTPERIADEIIAQSGARLTSSQDDA